MMTANKLRLESIKIIKQFSDAKLERGEGMVVLAMTLAVLFREDGVSQHEAVNRFVTIVKNVYQGEDK